jgi:branched-chain amino acid transport system ATP-binding protein
MLALAMAFICRPTLLLMDEPSMGLAPLIVREIFEVISKRKKETDLTVLLVEQNANAALSIADRGYVMETGKIILEESAAGLRQNQDVRRAYLGREQREIWE